MSTTTQYWARRSFGYLGAHLARGQVVTLRGSPNDEKLLRLGYVQELPRGAETYTCAECGTAFTDISARTAHGREDHAPPPVFESAAAEDAHEARRDAAMDQVAPLFYENTKASKDAGLVAATITTEPDAARRERKAAKKAAKKARKRAKHEAAREALAPPASVNGAVDRAPVLAPIGDASHG